MSGLFGFATTDCNSEFNTFGTGAYFTSDKRSIKLSLFTYAVGASLSAHSSAVAKYRIALTCAHISAKAVSSEI